MQSSRIEGDPLAVTSTPAPSSGNGTHTEEPKPTATAGETRSKNLIPSEPTVRTSVALPLSLHQKIKLEVAERYSRGERTDIGELIREGLEVILKNS